METLRLAEAGVNPYVIRDAFAQGTIFIHFRNSNISKIFFTILAILTVF